tara:strand:- start:217 stop:483 length:267 start_codon:yes stop_codon:yes gene_type:complete
MPTLHVPNSLLQLADGETEFILQGKTLREVFDDLIKVSPKLAEAIITSDGLRTELAVALDGSILDSTGLLESVRDDADIYLVPPIGGG